MCFPLVVQVTKPTDKPIWRENIWNPCVINMSISDKFCQNIQKRKAKTYKPTKRQQMFDPCIKGARKRSHMINCLASHWLRIIAFCHFGLLRSWKNCNLTKQKNMFDPCIMNMPISDKLDPDWLTQSQDKIDIQLYKQKSYLLPLWDE